MTFAYRNAMITCNSMLEGCAVLGRVIFVTAFKGGVGKTTVSAGIAEALAVLGKRVCLVDADFGMRCLDLVLGMESDVLYDCSDVLAGRCELTDAVAPVEGCDGLWFLASPIRFDGRELPKERVNALFDELRRQYDLCIVDSSAEMSPYYRDFACAADEALVVTLHQSTAIRAAEKTAANLAQLGYTRMHLVVNGYRAKSAEKGELPSLLGMIRCSAVPLVGAVPFCESLPTEQERANKLLSGRRRRARTYEVAFLNIALRLCGVQLPLLKGVQRPGSRKKCLQNAHERLKIFQLAAKNGFTE